MAEVEEAWRAGDFVTVRQKLTLLAETETEGSALAQYRLGQVLAEGRGGPRDLQGAADWLQKSVEQGNVEAAVFLARLYLSTKQEDAAKAAVGLLQQAAGAGNAEGQYYLGLLLRAGTGTEKRPEQSFTLFQAAANQGYVEAQYELARAYSMGEGVPQNNEAAVSWLTAAAGSGHQTAQMNLAAALDQGRGVAQDQTAALGWYLRAAEAGNPVAQREAGMHYLQGLGTEANPGEALRWLTTAAQAGEAGAQVNLGLVFSEGEKWGIPQDDAQAVNWYSQAAAQTSPQGMVALAGMMEAGRGTETDLPGAVDLLRRALRDTGFPLAALKLGQMAGAGKLDGLVAPQNAVPWALLAAEQGDAAAVGWLDAQAGADNRPAMTAMGLYLQTQQGQEARAAELFARAAEEGDVVAQLKLGEALTAGTGVAADPVTAHKWLNIAAAQGNSQAAQQRDALAQSMTPEQITQAQSDARIWFETESSRVPQTDQTERSETIQPRSSD
ncbi:MAG: tetratricopeptide repeat protein [Paracoccaceae bacterium]